MTYNAQLPLDGSIVPGTHLTGDVSGVPLNTVGKINGATLLMSGSGLTAGRTLRVVSGAKPYVYPDSVDDRVYILRKECDDLIIEYSGASTRYVLPLNTKPTMLALSSDSIWISSANTRVTVLTKVDRISGEVLAVYTMTTGGVSAIACDGTNVWLAGYADGNLTCFDPALCTFTTYSITYSAYSLYADVAGRIYCGCAGKIVRFNTTAHTHTVIAAPVITGRLSQFCLLRGTSALMVLDSVNARLYRFNTASDTFDAVNLLLGTPPALCMAYSGTNMLVGFGNNILQEVVTPEATPSLGFILPTPGVSEIPGNAQVYSIVYDSTAGYFRAMECGVDRLEDIDPSSGLTYGVKPYAGILAYVPDPGSTSCVISAGINTAGDVGYSAIGAAEFNASVYLDSYKFEVILQSSLAGVYAYAELWNVTDWVQVAELNNTGAVDPTVPEKFSTSIVLPLSNKLYEVHLRVDTAGKTATCKRSAITL